ncbi:hypothetical protein CSV80_06625 [Sporosarcina sp. P12(2017)]|uniref:hypothetical protein n=1 Tax=unclassified Sporosarcina TaxID=2647733 RepID=UPI000C16952D|nr:MULTISPECIES: hypothetical protein [unclassified Sporosarcina]PIC57974.1 hypothetical protein CSV81_06770 [Sporosarcina sp. P10]PIC61357.1 hypothetical protein CSV80_06625 [Sporosarcina sp. P12(2017)]
MKTTTGLYLFFIAIHLINLANITLFKGEWNGITMWLSTALFIAGTAYYAFNKSTTRKGE